VQDDYSLLNLRLAIGSETGKWQLALLARNITDEIVLSFGGDAPLSGTSFQAKSNYAFYGAGRTLTAQAIFRF
jgi:hypothetical protein